MRPDPKARKTAVIDACREAGFDVTNDQLQRWHGAGLLRPVVEGVAGGGSEVFYPRGAEKQTQAICRLLRAGFGLEDCLLYLWWASYQVDEERLRSLLLKTVAEWDGAVTSLVTQDRTELSEQGEWAVRDFCERRPSPLGSIRRGLRGPRCESFARAVILIIAGSTGSNAEERGLHDDLLWEGLGLESIPASNPLFRFLRRLKVGQALAEAARQLDLGAVARNANIEDLRTVRNWMRAAVLRILGRPLRAMKSHERDDPNARGRRPPLVLLRLTAVFLLLMPASLWLRVKHRNRSV